MNALMSLKPSRMKTYLNDDRSWKVDGQSTNLTNSLNAESIFSLLKFLDSYLFVTYFMTITDAKERILYFTIETQYLSLILSVFLTIPQSQTLRIIFQKLKMPITKTTSLCFKLYLKRQFNLFSTSSNSFPLMSKKMKRNSNKLYSKKSESMFTESQ